MSIFQKGVQIILSLNKHFGIEKELYFPIVEFPNYSISTLGNVKNIKTERVLMLNCDKATGYYKVTLCKNGKMKTVRIHNLVAKVYIPNPKNEKNVDHIDNNRLNNNINNLRWATNYENGRNQCLNKSNSSGIKGVSFVKKLNKWRSYIKMYGKQIHLGCFDTVKEAKQARLDKARECFGEYINVCEK